VIGYAIALLVAAFAIGMVYLLAYEIRSQVRIYRLMNRPKRAPGKLPDEAVRRFMDEDKRF
jgi:hypothetical protein